LARKVFLAGAMPVCLNIRRHFFSLRPLLVCRALLGSSKRRVRFIFDCRFIFDRFQLTRPTVKHTDAMREYQTAVALILNGISIRF